MNYCNRCVYPDTKPDLTLNEYGLCSACEAFEKREEIDWGKRKEEFKELLDYIKCEANVYDCIIPVSGGKDSHFQVIKALEYGLKPLAITATTDDLSIIGRRNLNNISKLGVDHIEISTNSWRT
jgi:tRNA(Ile)-lysidine synthase TilS/MesJ